MSSGLNALWVSGGLSTSNFVGTLTSTIINAAGGGQVASIKNALLFLLGKGGNYSNWYDLAWTVVDTVMAFLPGGGAVTAGKIVVALLKFLHNILIIILSISIDITIIWYKYFITREINSLFYEYISYIKTKLPNKIIIIAILLFIGSIIERYISTYIFDKIFL